ncbi:hypothetical protein [Methylobacterium sp. BTF04]|nr:hypothetical protein [Methylobacterium sp. BTF04]
MSKIAAAAGLPALVGIVIMPDASQVPDHVLGTPLATARMSR